MLGKLMKYELKWSARYLIPLYIILVFLTIAGRIAMGSSFLSSEIMSFISVIVLFGYIMLILAISIATFIVVILCFYRNLLTDEGYLMFTLPVKTSSLIFSKTMIACFWNLLSVIALGVSILLILTGNPVLKEEMAEGFQLMCSNFNLFFPGGSGVLFILEVISVIFIGIIYSVGYMYISIAIGQLISRNKILGSVAAYVVIGTVLQVAMMILSIILIFIFEPNFESFDMKAYHVFYWSALALSGVITGLFFYFTNRILSRKLNLE